MRDADRPSVVSHVTTHESASSAGTAFIAASTSGSILKRLEAIGTPGAGLRIGRTSPPGRTALVAIGLGAVDTPDASLKQRVCSARSSYDSHRLRSSLHFFASSVGV